MPIEHKTYGCKFKCGHKHSPNYARIYYHERDCWKNPANKTCLTCTHEDIYWTVDDCCYEVKERLCLQEIEFADGDTGKGFMKLKINCEKWEGKE
jgi:hypothetical protein